MAKAMNAVRHIVRALRVSSRAAERDLGVSAAQLFVLQQVAEEPAQSIAALAARTATDQSSVSVVVRRLVDRGLVIRAVSKRDARRTAVQITATGRALLRKMDRARDPRALAQARMIAALEALPKRKLDAVAGTLHALAIALGEGEDGPAPMFFEEEQSSVMKKAKKAQRHVETG